MISGREEGTLRHGSGDLSRNADQHRARAGRGVFEPDRLPLRRPAAAALPRHRPWPAAPTGSASSSTMRGSPISSAHWRWPSSCSIPVSARRSAMFRQAALPALSLATVGVALTTGLFGAAAHLPDRSFAGWNCSCSGRRRLDRRGGGVLPAARRQHQPARPRALHARNRVRHQRSDRHLPDHHAGRDDRAPAPTRTPRF